MRRDWVGNVVAGVLLVAALAAGTAAVVVPVAVLLNHSAHVSCLRLSEQTGLSTRYARSGLSGECYIQVDGKWIPEDRWRTVDGS